jgi:PBSX family phage terminase large subunit
MKKMSAEKKVISDELVRRGSIQHLLSNPQKKFYEIFNNRAIKSLGFFGTRRMGKSYSTLLFCFDYCVRNPRTIVRVVLPFLKMVKAIYEPIMSELYDSWPTELWPNYLKSESKLIFANGSMIVFGGAAKDQVDSNRGSRSDLIVIDEAAACDNESMPYLIESILRPQLATSDDGRMIFTATPARTPDHHFMKNIYPTLLSKGHLVVATIDDNNLLSDEQKKAIEESYGGRSSPAFRREFLGELIVDDSFMLCPEFNQVEHVISELPPQTDNFGNQIVCQAVIAVDVGLVDDTAIITGYYNPTIDKFIVTSEYLNNGMTLSQIAELIKERYDPIEANPLFNGPDMVIDVFDIASHSLRHDNKLVFRRPKKAKIEESINFLRDCFKNEKILIHNSCKGLIEQLKNCIWKENRKDVERSDELGHADAIFALLYGLREVRWGRKALDASPSKVLKFGSVSKSVRRRF